MYDLTYILLNILTTIIGCWLALFGSNILMEVMGCLILMISGANWALFVKTNR